MSISYVICPVNEEMLTYGQDFGVSIASDTAHGRFPVVDELISIMESIPGHRLTHVFQERNFALTIESEELVEIQPNGPFRQHSVPMTYLHLHGALSPDSHPRWMAMRGDMNVMLAFLRRLAETCGPQVFFYEGDGIPWFIVSGSDAPLGRESCPESWCQIH